MQIGGFMYCKYCGQKLQDGKCTCEKSQNNKFSVSNLAGVLKKYLKNPISTTSSYTKKGNIKNSAILIIASIFTNSLLFTLLINEVMAYLSNIVSINYVKMFGLVSIVQLIVLCAFLVISYIISACMSKSDKLNIASFINCLAISLLMMGLVSFVQVIFYLIFKHILYVDILLGWILIVAFISMLMFIILYYSGLKTANAIDYNRNFYLVILSILATILGSIMIINFIKFPTEQVDNHHNNYVEKNMYDDIWW